MKSGKKPLFMLLLVFSLVLLLSITALAFVPADYAPVAWPSFTATDGLMLSGTTTPSLDAANSRIIIVPYTTSQAGGVFTTDKVSMGSNGFSMAAQVYCGTTYTQADGFALVLAKSSNGCVTGSIGGSLGYAIMADSIAVQYFTYGASNIALGVNGYQNRNSGTYVGFSVPSGGSVYIWADYDAADTQLAVYAATTGTRPADPVTTYTIDLSSYSDYYLGVTAATGDSCQEYALAQLYYDEYYHSGSLKLDGSLNYSTALAADDIIAQSAEDVTSSSATLRGVWGSGYDSGYTKGIAYREGESGAETEVAAAADGTVDLSGLTNGTLYYYRAYAVDDITEIYSYSTDKVFTTLDTCTVTVAGGGYIGDNTSTTTAEVDDGSRVTVTAPSVDGKVFDYWEASDSPVSSDNPYTFTVAGDITLTAVYFDGFAGLGTAASPYQITDKADLDLLSELVADGYDFAGRYFIVTQNIEMQDPETPDTDYFVPIGSYYGDYPFSGNFDGNGKTVSGLEIDVEYAGLFGYIDGAAIADLTVSGADISGDSGAGAIAGYAEDNCTISGCTATSSNIYSNNCAGGIISSAEGETDISKCTVTGCDIDGYYYAGGVVGYAYENMDVSDCAVTDSTISSESNYAGGIVGEADYYTSITNCTVTDCQIDGYYYAGGVVGYAYENMDVSGCTVTDSTISSESDYTGGVVGYAEYYNSITNCAVTDCQIDGYGTGGIAGYLEDSNNIFNCSVTNTADNMIGSDGSYAGGIVGYLDEDLTVYNCTVSGYSIASAEYTGGIIGCGYDYIDIICCDVTASPITGEYAGGIVGYLDDYDSISYCTVTGCSISGEDYTGGIAGYMYYQPKVTYCTVSGGSITAETDSVGGIIGYADVCDYTGKISNCKVACDITVNDTSGAGGDQYIGGILGYGYSLTMVITDCEYSGDITASSTDYVYAGGIIGYNYGYDSYGGTTVSNCVAYGTITAPAGGTYDSHIGGIYGYSDDYNLTFTNDVAMQSSLTGDYVNSLYAYSSVEPTVTGCYGSSAMVIDNYEDLSGGAGDAEDLADMDGAFWSGLGYTTAGGWQQTTSGNVTAAPVEAHLLEATVYTLTVSGNATPYFMDAPLAESSSGTYTTFDGMEITMKSADKNYKISGISINGTPVNNMTFTVTGNTRVVVSMTENAGDFWIYDGKYVFGVYDEDSSYGDIDWTDAADSSTDPLTGAYANANVYVLDYEEIYIDRLNLGLGSVICKDDNDYYFYLYGYDDGSYLIADRIVNTYDSGDVYIEYLDVYANALYINDELDIYDSNVMADTVTTVINCCDMEIWGSSTLTVGTIYAAVDDYDDGSSIYICDNSVLTADNITGTLYFEACDNAVVNISNDLETPYLEVWGNAKVTIGGDLTTTYYDSELFDTSLLDVGGTITTLEGNYIYNLGAAILNAQSDSDTPHYYDNNEAYVRTTLEGLPANTLMRFATSGGTYNMDFWARTNYAGILTVWLIPNGGTITATTPEGVGYSCADVIGNPEATLNMGHVVTINDVTVAADVPEEQVSGQIVSCDNIAVDSDNQLFAYDEANLDLYLTDANEQDVELGTPLSEGTYYLTVVYVDELNSFYGTATYTVHVRDQRTIAFDANGGGSIDDVLAWKGDDLTLPTAARSGYRLTGWFDGALTYAPGSEYPVYVDSELTAQWVKSGGGGSTTYYTITAGAGEGGDISPSGSVSVASGNSKTFTITPADGYVIKDVLADGESAGAVSKYTFTNISSDHTIQAVFAKEAGLSDQFADLIPGAWYQESIEYVLKAGLFNGTSETTFSPNANMTRAMLVTVLWRLSGASDASSASNFSDVESGLWYSDAINWASSNGIIGGYGNGLFGTNDSITREQIAVILYNYAKYMGYDTTQTGDLSQYSDNGEISSWAAEAMAWANATGLITGRTEDTLAAQGNATRAELATILMRFIEYYK